MISASARHIASGGGDPPADLSAAAGAGYTALVWSDPRSLFAEPALLVEEIASQARAAGLRLIVEVDPALFPADHPLVTSHPQAFRLRRSPAEHAAVDPRKPAPVTGEAWARLHEPRFAGLFEEPLGAVMRKLVRQGANGFRIKRAGNIDAALLSALVGALREHSADLVLVGDAGEGESPNGLDFLVSASARPVRGATPVLNEIRLDGRTGAETHAAVLEAAALGDGIIVPLELVTRDDPTRKLAAEAARLAGETAPFAGELRYVSGAGAPVGAFVRGDAVDLRHSDEALLILSNNSDRQVPAPMVDDLSVAANFGSYAPVGGGAGLDAQLEPGEVRVLRGRRGKSIAAAAPGTLEYYATPSERVVVDEVSPRVEGGSFPVKRVVGDRVKVEAIVFADGHEKMAAELRWRAVDETVWQAARMEQLDNDKWRASFPLERLGRHEFVVEGWVDRFGGCRRDLGKKVDAGVAQPVDFAEGRLLVEEAAAHADSGTRKALLRHLAAYDGAEEEEQADHLLAPELATLMDLADERAHRRSSPPQMVDAERTEAQFSSWYELFPRSMTEDKNRHGTFADVIEHLPRVRAMGFDTLYFPPIHPIGKTNRKGPNNTLTPGPDDPGSPYAIGSAEGGHDAIHPELGSFDDFDRLVSAARDHGLEIALDFAIQASPDHPWLKEHPGWFAWRPDGSMKYAENPPKKYQDIVNVDFYGPDAIPGLWEALRDVVLLWVQHGVKTFRVDNPHTKPLPFWEWMIGEVRAQHPEVIFLSEAFTRPTMMYQLAKIGFSQSYTYFTWRDRKHELMEYITELTTTAPKDFYRPHFFVNTPDINPHYLQTSGRPGFRIRAVLAATLSGLWGVYSGFELCDGTPLAPGKEEYLDSEKFEIRPRDWNAPGNIIPDIALLNRLRREHPALQTHLNTRFFDAHDDNIIWYGKPAPDGSEMIMVMVNLDPHHAQECGFEVPLWQFGLDDNAAIDVEDLAEGHRFQWHGKWQSIRLSPDAPYRIWRLSAPGGLA